MVVVVRMMGVSSADDDGVWGVWQGWAGLGSAREVHVDGSGERELDDGEECAGQDELAS